VLVEPFAFEYIEDALDIDGSTRLVVDAFVNFRLEALYKLILPGEGRAGCFLSKSLSLCIPMLFGFENSFIFDFSFTGLASLSGTGGGPLSIIPGEYCGLRGYEATCAAVAAARLWPPINPSIFLKP
jgi:hypothetical protein